MDHPPLWRRIVNFPLVAMILAVAVYVTALLLADVVSRFLIQGVRGPDLRAAVSAAVAITFLLASYKLITAHLGDHPRDDLPASAALKLGGIGLALGFGLMTAMVGVAAVMQVYRITGPGDTALFGLEVIGTSIVPGFTEELLFRGILFRWIEEMGGSWVGLIVSSLVFGFAHYFNPGATVSACLWIALEAGVLFGGAYMLTRSLWMPMGIHAAWNFTQGEVFDVPVSGLDEHGLVHAQMSGPPLLSGGGFGLEASVIGLVIATAAGIWLVWLAARRGLVVQPWWVSRRRAAA